MCLFVLTLGIYFRNIIWYYIVYSELYFEKGEIAYYILHGDFPLAGVDSNLKVILWNKNL